MVPLPAASSKTVPSLAPPAASCRRGCPAGPAPGRPDGIGPVGAVERGQGGDGAAAGGELEDRAIAVGPAERRRAEEVAPRVAHQAAERIGPVGAVEGGQGGDGAAAGSELEDRALAVGPAELRRAEEVAQRVAHQAGNRQSPVGAVERGQGGERGVRGGLQGDRVRRPGGRQFAEAARQQGPLLASFDVQTAGSSAPPLVLGIGSTTHGVLLSSISSLLIAAQDINASWLIE